MKRNSLFKILSFFAVFCMCFSLVACITPDSGNNNTDGGNVEGDGDDKHIHGEVNELLTVEELVEFHLNGAKYPENFVFEELNGYGRVIASSSSREDALSKAAEHFNSGWCTTVENRLEVETDLFYGLYVKWDYRSGGVGEPTSYYDEYVVSFKKSVYDAENKQFFTKDEDEIKSILDYNLYSGSYQIFGSKVYSSEIAAGADNLQYKAYSLMVIGGDFGIQDELLFIRTDIQIDLATGETAYNDEVVGTVFIDGAGTNYGGEC